MPAVQTIIWDLGGVLVDWNPRYVFTDTYFPSEEERAYFFQHVCTAEWNEEQDAGRSIAEATRERIARYPEWEKAIRDYYDRWEEMLYGPIQPTVELFRQLKNNPLLRHYALTNWSAETFPVALDRFDFLHWFDGRLVSGEERMRKPFPEFYRLLLDRFVIDPDSALFIDDNLRNVEAAEKLGIKSIQFNSTEQLKMDLKSRSIL